MRRLATVRDVTPRSSFFLLVIFFFFFSTRSISTLAAADNRVEDGVVS
jgi:hypothetical protein